MKDAYYFPHDSNAHCDPKITMLFLEMGAMGYGIYWVIIEMLRNEPTYKMSFLDTDAVAYQSHCKDEDVRKVIREFGLFKYDDIDKIFWSESLINRMRDYDAKREKARASANLRWHKDANAMPTQCDGNAVKYSKVKKSSIAESKEPSATKEIFDHFKARFNTFRGVGYVVRSYGKDMKLLKDVLSQLDKGTVTGMVDDFFKSKDQFVVGSDYSVGVFVSQINKLNKPKKATVWETAEKL
jgi:hypothetical protein